MKVEYIQKDYTNAKVKIFAYNAPDELADEVNDFIANRYVVDIQYSSTSDFYEVMVVYKED